MTKLTTDQIRFFTSYSIYVDTPNHPLFTLQNLLDEQKSEELIELIAWRSSSPNRTVAASYFMRRIGMFYAMQIYQMIAYDEYWKGELNDLVFGAAVEFDLPTISMYVQEEHWATVPHDRQNVLNDMLKQIAAVIRQLRSVATVSPLTLWENVFGFALWHFATLLEHPATELEAEQVLALLKDPKTWQGIASNSLFSNYLKGAEPKQLLQTTVRTTCCFSKDVPGLMQCGFCPLKSR